MKTLFYLTLVLCFVSSCSAPCTEDILGVYEGVLTEDQVESEIKYFISQNSTGDYDVLIDTNLLEDEMLPFHGVVTDDCSIIDITFEYLNELGEVEANLEGRLNVSGNELTGNLNFYIEGDLVGSSTVILNRI